MNRLSAADPGSYPFLLRQGCPGRACRLETTRKARFPYSTARARDLRRRGPMTNHHSPGEYESRGRVRAALGVT
jgi:hypothetical protein